MLLIKRYMARSWNISFQKNDVIQKIKMDFYLCHSTLPHETCCRCTKTCKYYGTRLLTFEIKKSLN